MSSTTKLNYHNFRIATIISTTVAVIIIALSIYFGKSEFFLMLNDDLGTAGDYFFQYFTHLGDGALWAAWLVWILVKKQKPILPLILSSFILDTVFTQIFKQVIFPNEMRPSEAIKDGSFIHYVEGVTVHSINSFPSGHTATAFTFVFLIALTTRGKSFMALGLIVAMLVGYSRVYLGQHFPFDVGGGIIVAVISVMLSIPVQKRFERKWRKQDSLKTT